MTESVDEGFSRRRQDREIAERLAADRLLNGESLITGLSLSAMKKTHQECLALALEEARQREGSAFLRGMASLVDFWGVLPELDYPLRLARPLSDAEAIASDWRAIGQDLYNAISTVAAEDEWRKE